MSEPLRGIFPVVLTPYAEDGSIDMEALAREVDFSVQAGTHGLVFPVLGSEFQYLSDAERRAAVEVVVRQAGGRV
ncbi:MAG: dihydrodipicolinate synthase family protein, partial [Spirochaetaceae bacterium]|nr:dihydrodipicolinate synthase family protein [Spirochaetaceae bacterium]